MPENDRGCQRGTRGTGEGRRVLKTEDNVEGQRVSESDGATEKDGGFQRETVGAGEGRKMT